MEEEVPVVDEESDELVEDSESVEDSVEEDSLVEDEEAEEMVLVTMEELAEDEGASGPPVTGNMTE